MIPTPCVGVCKIDSQTMLCMGCGRTIKEITDWAQYDRQYQLQLMEELNQREGPHLRNQRRVS